MAEVFPNGIRALPFTVFSNMRINNDIRLQRLKDSFLSFYSADIPKWIINIRGSHKDKAGEFLSEKLGEKLSLSFYASEEGWFFDTQHMLEEASIDTKYVFYWIEDNICTVKSYILNCIVQEMDDMQADIMQYTLFMNGNTNKKWDFIPRERGKNIDVIVYDEEAYKVMQLRMVEDCLPYIVCLPSFFRTNLFRRLVMTEPPMPLKWKNTPFAMEKRAGHPDWMPMRTALSRQELFAAIDDSQTTPGSSLIARGLYPQDIGSREELGSLDGGEVSGCFAPPTYTFFDVPIPLWVEYVCNMWWNKFDKKSRDMFIWYMRNRHRCR